MKLFNFYFAFGILICTNISAVALTPEDDIPEEILATEIIIEGRSQLNNQNLTVNEYVLEKQKESSSPFSPELDSQIQHNVLLLRIFKLLRTITPIK
jgi:hypothetical protein